MKDVFSLANKTAVVVGGTSGIGRMLSIGLAQAGADVVASARRKENVEETAAEIERCGRRTLRLYSDVCDRSSLEHLFAESVREFKKVDILLNCAGITTRVPTLAVPEEQWSEIIETNLTGILRSCQIFGKHMVERGKGRIINIASLSSFLGFLEVAAYGASKAGLMSLTRHLAVEWARKGVTVNAIVPGIFRTALNADLLDNTTRGRNC